MRAPPRGASAGNDLPESERVDTTAGEGGRAIQVQHQLQTQATQLQTQATQLQTQATKLQTQATKLQTQATQLQTQATQLA